ncbi:MAG TPA: EamA family transporter RarD [Sphingomonadales bacterium]|nr:EamA family transporter RarD [Sphingomonadales bacterium]
MSEIQTDHPVENNTAGIAYALGAFILWGLAPIYFKELSHVPALEFLGFRMVWSFIFLIILLFFRRSLKILIQEIGQTFANKKLLFMLFLSAVLISSNWLVFIWAVANNHVMETSLGYFINPLVNVALGMLVLGERLSRVKLIAVGIATFGVIYLIVAQGIFPWVALYLAGSFALYGLIRKKVVIGAILGLWVEMLVLLPFAVGYLSFLNFSATSGRVSHDDYTLFMLILSGAVTTIPLVFFASAARRLPLSLLGLLQYIAPTMTLLMAVFLWGELFTTAHMVAFSCIWGALAIYSADSFFPVRNRRG